MHSLQHSRASDRVSSGLCPSRLRLETRSSPPPPPSLSEPSGEDSVQVGAISSPTKNPEPVHETAPLVSGKAAKPQSKPKTKNEVHKNAADHGKRSASGSSACYILSVGSRFDTQSFIEASSESATFKLSPHSYCEYGSSDTRKFWHVEQGFAGRMSSAFREATNDAPPAHRKPAGVRRVSGHVPRGQQPTYAVLLV